MVSMTVLEATAVGCVGYMTPSDDRSFVEAGPRVWHLQLQKAVKDAFLVAAATHSYDVFCALQILLLTYNIVILRPQQCRSGSYNFIKIRLACIHIPWRRDSRPGDTELGPFDL